MDFSLVNMIDSFISLALFGILDLVQLYLDLICFVYNKIIGIVGIMDVNVVDLI